jgi:hypothetical protein
MQTGTVHPDPQVRKAKAIQRDIINKCELSDGEGPEPLYRTVGAVLLPPEDVEMLEQGIDDVAMPCPRDDTDNVSVGSHSTDTEKHIRIIRSDHRRPDPSGVLVGVGATLPTPKVIRVDLENEEKEKAEREPIDVSDEASIDSV